MKKKLISVFMVAAFGASLLAGCGSNASNDTAATSTTEGATSDTTATEDGDKTTITVFAAASLNTVLDELIEMYNETNPDIEILTNYDSSGTLMEQIEEGASCDVFFSAAQKQMDQLQDQDNLVVEGTRHNVVNNQLCVVTYPDSGTEVTGLADLNKASSIALCDGTVPVGKYTRVALMNSGVLDEVEDASVYTTQEVSDALGGVEINETANVSATASAVAEGSNEVGMVYYSDTYGIEDQLEIIEVVSYDLSGNIIYPVAQIANEEATDAQSEAAVAFINYLKSDEATKVFQEHYFDTDVED
ncbi:molybdate ABC transporter substrate-binding protein [Eubacterium oxidoreducens]|uniref:Molybdate transport system substrate-binding protein n=1 Tax=Eubacterium oxidoreducens TaxID=1732 RepID=A0A1G5ZZH2_EUBOX|nr:molybdate ABC transporter substrate-binding protein [Eubacterium oxidoreducens]SDB01619.1 molybdate transport system substrate-binding protein [Eubacterium oxidoreducens]